MIKVSAILKSKTLNAVAMLGVLLSSCTNISEKSKLLGDTTDPSSFSTSTSSVVNYTHYLKSISVGAPSTGTGYELSLSVDSALTGFVSLNQYCGVSGSNPCSCELSWTELNTVGGVSTSIPRKKKFAVTSVQSAIARCVMDSDFWNEIASGTTISMNIVGGPSNLSGIVAKALNYKKGTTTTSNGDFYDDTLTPFRNIHRYSCHSKFQRAHELVNAVTEGTNSATSQTVSELLASEVCTGEANQGQGCQTVGPRVGFSAQNYYRNLYVRSDVIGQINSSNNHYDCPRVVEALQYSSGQTIPDATKGKYWPLDASFALATSRSPDWSVPVSGPSVLYKNGDPNSAAQTCEGEGNVGWFTEKNGGIVYRCLGWAKKPNPGGTCGTITDSNGGVRPLTRIRRYRVVYPPQALGDGSTNTLPLEADQIYVADRLTVDANGVLSGNMIYGPKPCPFSWFDHEGTVNRNGTSNFFTSIKELGVNSYPQPRYVATNQFTYSGLRASGAEAWSVNPDGIVFPNYDLNTVDSTTNVSLLSCSASLPYITYLSGSASSVQLKTTHYNRTDTVSLGNRTQSLREVHVTPVDPWMPIYVEDTSFEACAPMSDPYLDPPIHVYKKDADAYGWCAKPYPNQNPYWEELNKKRKTPGATLADSLVGYPGVSTAEVPNWTGHVDNAGLLDGHNSCVGTPAAKASEVCNMTSAGAAACTNYITLGAHEDTCDRTVVFDSNQAYRDFPLQADDAATKAALAADLDYDKTYSCQYSVHSSSSKVNAKVPSTACCGVSSGTAILSGVIAGAAGSDGHLEPFKSAGNSSSRYCGSPVD